MNIKQLSGALLLSALLAGTAMAQDVKKAEPAMHDVKAASAAHHRMHHKHHAMHHRHDRAHHPMKKAVADIKK